LADGEYDSSIADLANSIEPQGLLNPITVFETADGRYAVIAGQRRLLACKQLGQSTIAAIVRNSTNEADATAISLVENVHRADMNPRDKALALKALLDKYEELRTVSRETGIGVPTIRKYLQLLDLAPELQQQLAAGEAKHTEALARLAQTVEAQDQPEVWNKIRGFTQDVQCQVITRLSPDLGNLDNLMDRAAEGAFNYHVVRNCPFDCPAVPKALKAQIADMITAFKLKEIR
jgi:ParB family chromosome partitioning protein